MKDLSLQHKMCVIPNTRMFFYNNRLEAALLTFTSFLQSQKRYGLYLVSEENSND